MRSRILVRSLVDPSRGRADVGGHLRARASRWCSCAPGSARTPERDPRPPSRHPGAEKYLAGVALRSRLVVDNVDTSLVRTTLRHRGRRSLRQPTSSS